MFFSDDILFGYPTIQSLQIHAASGDKATYAYLYDHIRMYITPHDQTHRDNRTGAGHAEEMPLVFGAPLTKGIQE